MKLSFAAAASLALAGVPAQAIEVKWVDWTGSTATSVTGDLEGTGVTFSSPAGFAFVQTNGGTNYWTQPVAGQEPYTSGSVSNAPPGTDIIALNAGGTKTITFDQAITGLYIALVSWNGNVVQFDQPFTKISEGRGYWGPGSFNSGSSSFVGTGEPHGILYFPGTFTSLTFTDTTENWHGLTIGIGAFASAVPEPATWALMIAGFGAAGVAIRRRRRTPLATA